MTILDAAQLARLIDSGESALADFLSALGLSCRDLARRGIVNTIALDEMEGPLADLDRAGEAMLDAGLDSEAESLWERAHNGLDRIVMLAALDPWGPAERH